MFEQKNARILMGEMKKGGKTLPKNKFRLQCLRILYHMAKKDSNYSIQKRIEAFPLEVQHIITKGKDQKFITEQELMHAVPNVKCATA